jgi:FYVE/RhoGEF/PH domain-containing protein 5/6
MENSSENVVSEEEKLKMERKRRHVIEEMISTEKTYLNRLEAIVDIFIIPLRNSGKIIDSIDIQGQFGYWENIYLLHKDLLSTMMKDFESGDLLLGKLFSGFSPFLKMYKQYLVDYERALSRRAVLMTSNKKFQEFVEAARLDPKCTGLALESLLIEPVQRIPRYRMLLEQLIKYTSEDHEDFISLTKALVHISEVASGNNEAIRQRENKEKIMSIMMSIEPRSRVNLLDDNDRKLIHEGVLLRQTRRTQKEFQFWLFNDKLLYGEILPGLNLYTLNHYIDLATCRISPGDPTVENFELSFVVESPEKSFVVWAKTTGSRLEWLSNISNTIDLQRAKIHAETGIIAPIWAPDKTVLFCPSCDVEFSIIKRKHHCRSCGTIVCNKCSLNRFELSHVDANNMVRVCDNCFDDLSKTDLTDRQARGMRHVASVMAAQLPPKGPSAPPPPPPDDDDDDEDKESNKPNVASSGFTAFMDSMNIASPATNPLNKLQFLFLSKTSTPILPPPPIPKSTPPPIPEESPLIFTEESPILRKQNDCKLHSIPKVAPPLPPPKPVRPPSLIRNEVDPLKVVSKVSISSAIIDKEITKNDSMNEVIEEITLVQIDDEKE